MVEKHANGYVKEWYNDMEGLLLLPSSLLLLLCWKCQRRRQLSKSRRRKQKNSGRRHEEEKERWERKQRTELEEKEKTVRSVTVRGRRGTAGGINTLNVNHRHLAAKEREVETEMWDIRRGDRVREWVRMTKVDRMMEGSREEKAGRNIGLMSRKGERQIQMILCVYILKAFLFIWLKIVKVMGFSCSDGSVCVWKGDWGRQGVKTDKSCQLAVLPRNLLTASLSCLKQHSFTEKQWAAITPFFLGWGLTDKSQRSVYN